MRQIELTQGKVALVDDADFEFLSQWKWCAIFKKATGLWYAQRRVTIAPCRTKIRYMHQELLPVSAPLKVDHKDGDGLNNQRANLRAATHQQNLYNRGRSKNNTSGAKGIYWNKLNGKWRVKIRANGKSIEVGSFRDKEVAALAYQAAALKLHGDFAHF